jgi:hypothetical protein
MKNQEARRLRVCAAVTMFYIVRTCFLLSCGDFLHRAFLTAERMSNLDILASGDALRAECVLRTGRGTTLRIFHLTFLQNDFRHDGFHYSNYTISSYNYDLTIERVRSCLVMSATVIASERVRAQGNIKGPAFRRANKSDYPPPNGRPNGIDFVYQCQFTLVYLRTGGSGGNRTVPIFSRGPTNPHSGRDPTPKPTSADSVRLTQRCFRRGDPPFASPHGGVFRRRSSALSDAVRTS